MYNPEVLIDYYLFSTHPFEPKIDPKTNFDFQQNKVSLLREINMFQHAALANCFIEVGPFAEAAKALREYVAAVDYDPLIGDPPALLIQGTRGTGVDTVAKFAAFLFKEKGGAGANMSLQSIGIPTDSQPRLLMLLKQKLKTHLAGIADAQTVFEEKEPLIKADDPDQSYLESLFSELKEPAAQAPPLILTIGVVTWDRRDWMKWLYKLLNPLNVLLIFLTDDTRVAQMFDVAAQKRAFVGKSVRLKGLTAVEGRELAEKRFEYFRASTKDPRVFPFNSEAFARMFDPAMDEGRLGVKFLIQVLRGSMNQKLSDLSATYRLPPPPDADIEVTWQDIKTAYQTVVRTPGE